MSVEDGVTSEDLTMSLEVSMWVRDDVGQYLSRKHSHISHEHGASDQSWRDWGLASIPQALREP